MLLSLLIYFNDPSTIVTTTSVTKQIHNVTTTSVTNNQGHNIWPHVSSIRYEQQWPKHLPQKQGWQQHLPSFSHNKHQLTITSVNTPKTTSVQKNCRTLQHCDTYWCWKCLRLTFSSDLEEAMFDTGESLSPNKFKFCF